MHENESEGPVLPGKMELSYSFVREGTRIVSDACSGLSSNGLTLLLTAAGLAVDSAEYIFTIFIARVLIGGQPGVAVTGQRLVLLGEVDAARFDALLATLGKSTGALRETRLHNGLGGHPVAESIFAILDDGLAGIVAVVCLAGLAGSHWGVVNQVQKVLAVPGDDGDLFAVLAQSVELILEGGLDLLTGDVGQLGLSDKGLGLGADKLLLQNDNSGRVGILVFQLGNLISDLLLACEFKCQRETFSTGRTPENFDVKLHTVSARLYRGLNVSDALDGDTVLVVAVDEHILQLTDLVDQNAELIRHIRHILVAGFTPD